MSIIFPKKAEIETETIVLIILFLLGIAVFLGLVLSANTDLGLLKGKLADTIASTKP